MRRRTVTPLQLIKRIRSSRYSLPKRLYTMALLAQRLDQLCMAQAVEASSENQVNPAVGADPCAPTASQTPGTVAELNRWFQELSHLLHEQLLPKLKRRRLELTSIDELTLAQNYTLHRYFQEQLYPLLTPLAVDPGHPFPRIMAHNLHFLVTLQATVPFYRVHNTTTAFSPLGQFYHTPPRAVARWDENEIYGLVKISDHGPRFIPIQPDKAAPQTNKQSYVWREDVVRHFISSLFTGMNVTGIYQFRVVCAVPCQSPDCVTTEPWDAPNGTADHVIARLRQPPVTHLDVEAGMPAHLIAWLVGHLRVDWAAVNQCPPPFALADLAELSALLSPSPPMHTT